MIYAIPALSPSKNTKDAMKQSARAAIESASSMRHRLPGKAAEISSALASTRAAEQQKRPREHDRANHANRPTAKQSTLQDT